MGEKLGIPIEERYEAALDYLKNLTKFGINLGLGRIQELLKRLGNPENRLQVIHVGGTNGKGSTSMMTAEILREAGYKVGVFTSPHLHDYRERIVINGRMISKEKLVEILDKIRPVLDQLVAGGIEHPTEFEVSTAIAFAYFDAEKVDYALIEVGLGGEIDSTNVVSPLISVITNVGMDHMDYLGNTVEEIAKIKAGIIKSGSVAVTAADRPEVLKILEKKAKDLGIKLWKIGEDVQWESLWSGELGQEINITGLHGYYPGIRLNLAGGYQIKNAATALAICEILKVDYDAEIPREAIYAGFNKVQWPGRLELISRKPKILLDGAHNVDGAEALAQALGNYSRKRLILCLGMLADKEREKVVNILAPLADEVIVTRPNSPRAGDWRHLEKLVRTFVSQVSVIDDPKEAVIKGMEGLEKEDLLCVTGSLYMIADARQALLDKLKRTTI